MNEIIEIADYKNECGEGPIWDVSVSRLLWLDAEGEDIYEYLPGEEKSRNISQDLRVSSMVLDKEGLILLGSGLWFWPEGGKKTQVVTEYDGEELFFNDSIAGPDGNIYAGTYYWGEEGMGKSGKLYRISPDLEVSVLDEGIELSNGFAFSPDNKKLYHADSSVRCINVYDFIDGTISNKRPFVRFAGDRGLPDGITVDAEGYLWCAVWYDGVAERYDPEGKFERRIEFPARQVSSLTFGGDDLDVLYVTSANGFFAGELVPPGFPENSYLGGTLYATKPGVRGRPENIVDFNIKEKGINHETK